MSENKAFTVKLVARAQRLAPTDPFAIVARDYLIKVGRLVFDDARGLFWVLMPGGPTEAQVALFMPMLDPNPA